MIRAAVPVDESAVPFRRGAIKVDVILGPEQPIPVVTDLSAEGGRAVQAPPVQAKLLGWEDSGTDLCRFPPKHSLLSPKSIGFPLKYRLIS